jgi:long-chain acyl-CoA synthetase
MVAMRASAGATPLSQLFLAAVADHEHEPAPRTPDGAVAWTWAQYGQLGRTAGDPELRAEVDARTARANQRLARVEQIKRIAVPPVDRVVAGAELTPTSKLKGRAIFTQYSDEIEALYV